MNDTSEERPEILPEGVGPEATDSSEASVEVETAETETAETETAETETAETETAETETAETETAETETAETETAEAETAESVEVETAEAETNLLRSGVLERVAAQVTPGRGAPELELCAQLFSAHKPLSELDLAEAMGLSVEKVAGTLARLGETLEDSPFGVFRRRITLPGKTKSVTGYVLDLKADFRRNVVTVGRPVLGQGLTETLALIALNQPIIQSRLVRERGSSVYDHVKELVQRDWVIKVKRGRSSELRTTETFAAEFGLVNDPELIKRALARAAGVEGAPQIVASERVAFEHEQAVTLYTEAQQFVPSAEELLRREQERLAREAMTAEARALQELAEAPSVAVPRASVAPASGSPAPADPFARLAAALEASERNRREDCVVSGGGEAPDQATSDQATPDQATPDQATSDQATSDQATPGQATPGLARIASAAPDASSEPEERERLDEGLVSGGAPPQPNRLAEVLKEEAAMRAEKEKEEPETPEQEESQSRVAHLLNLLGDDSTDDDW